MPKGDPSHAATSTHHRYADAIAEGLPYPLGATPR